MSEHAISNAKGWLESIVEMVAKLHAAREGETECGQCEGTGTIAGGPGGDGDDEECPVCNGAGTIACEDDEDGVRQEIDESALSVSIRSGWYSPGAKEDSEPEEFEVLLTTGGPALRIYGTLGQFCEPDTVRLQWQDWGTPWTDYHDTTEAEDSALEEFTRCFWFGE